MFLPSFIHWNVDPEIIRLVGVFPLKYYSLLFLSGLVLSYVYVKRIYRREGVPVEQLDQLTVYIFFGTLLGARLGHCLFYEPVYFFHHPLEILLPIAKINGSYQFTGFLGLASHGGTIGVLLAIWLYCRKYKRPLLWVLDRVALATPIACTFIRLGNLMNSEMIGKPTGGSYGVIFDRVDQIPRHPGQVYEALAYLLIFFILNALFRQERIGKSGGFMVGALFLLVFTARFIIEFFKIDQEGFEQGMLFNMGQLLSIPFMLTGSYLMYRSLKYRRQEPPLAVGFYSASSGF